MPGTDYREWIDQLPESERQKYLEKRENLAELLTQPVPKSSKAIHMLKGLPASGKTTMALEMVKEEKVKRISKDDLRAMLHGGKYSPETEAFVLDVRNAIVKLAIQKGFDVVIDDTNLNPVHQEQLSFLADYVGALFHIIEMDTSLEECIRRDEQRAKPVGEDVIRNMYEKYMAVK